MVSFRTISLTLLGLSAGLFGAEQGGQAGGVTPAVAQATVGTTALTSCDNFSVTGGGGGTGSVPPGDSSPGDDDPDDAYPQPPPDPTPTGGGTCSICPPQNLMCNGSYIDNYSFNHIHEVLDYVAPQAQLNGDVGSSCTSCSSTNQLPKSYTQPASLKIRRMHRFREVGIVGSFGPGVFLSAVDTHLTVRLSPQGGYFIDVFNPERTGYIRFLDGAWTNTFNYTDALDGVYHDVIANAEREIRIFDSAGNLTTNPMLATTAVLTAHTGQKRTFQFVDVDGVRIGRLVSTADRNGYAQTVSYRYQPGDDLQGSTQRLMQVNRIADAYGRYATVNYAAAQISGQWVVSSINLPNGQTLTYGYAGGFLTSVGLPGGDQATFSYSYDTVSKCQVIAYNDPAAVGVHRKKTVYLTASAIVMPDSDTNGIWPQAMQLIRLLINGANEVAYLNVSNPIYNQTNIIVGNSLRQDVWWLANGNLEHREMFAKDGWKLNAVAPSGPYSWSSFQTTFEPTYKRESYGTANNYAAQYKMIPKLITNKIGIEKAYIYNDAGYTTSVTAPDTGLRKTERNVDQQITRQVDALGRVDEFDYNAQGNVTTHRTGKRWDAATQTAVTTADTATWTYQYIPAGQTNQYRLLATIDPRGNRTDFTYTNAGYLASVTGPADAIGGSRPTTTFAYNAFGLITQKTESGVSGPRITGYIYDNRNRLTVKTHPDGSSEQTVYGSGVLANLVVTTIDRNLTRTELGYDLAGRLVTRQVVSASNVVLETESWTYATGTDRVASHTSNGSVATYTSDNRERVVAVTTKPKAGASLSSVTVYGDDNRVAWTQDAYGRRTFQVTDIMGREVKTIQELVVTGVGVIPTDPAQRLAFLSALPRVLTANPPYVVHQRAFNLNGDVIAVIDPASVQSTWNYTWRGQIAAATEAVGSTEAASTQYVYDLAGNRTHVINAMSRITLSTYTGRNLLATITRAYGTAEAATTTYAYTITGKQASATDALGRSTVFQYGGCCDRLLKIVDPAGFETTFTYDAEGNRLTATDGNGLTATTTYDGLHRELTSSNAAAETTTTTYDENLTDGVGLDIVPAVAAVLPSLGLGAGADGSAIAVANPKGETAYELRDGLGRPMARIDPLGHATRIAYDAVVGGLVETTKIDALGNSTKVRTDATGQARVLIDAMGNQSLAGFAADGDQVSQVDALGLGWTAVYDARHRLLSRTTTRADAVETTSWTYDLVGNRLTETDALGKTEASQYDLRNRRVVLTDRLGGLTRFAYDAVGNLTAISDAENEARGGLSHLAGTTQYAYDSRNLLVAHAFPTGQAGRTLRVYAYDAGSRLTARQVGVLSGTFGTAPTFTGSPEATTYAYDSANRLLTRGYADAANDTFTYDLASRLTTAVSARYATTVGRTHDAAGRPISESITLPDGSLTGTLIAPATYTIAYQYDATNRMTGLTYPTGTQVARTYTTRHELATVSMGGSSVATRSYDAAGRLVSTVFGNGVTESRTFVAGSPLAASIAVGPAVTGFSYTYDAAGRKLAEQNSVASDHAFGYDFAGRLIDWKQGPTAAPTATQTWNLSLVGDWNATNRDGVTESRQNTWVHEAVQVGTILLTYDSKGNLTKDDKQTLLTWDPENRLTSALVAPDASETGFGAYATYRYDALGRRVAKTVNGATTLYLNAGVQTVVEMERAAIPTQAQVNGAESDGTATNAALTPASGGILTGVGAVTRINFQPETTAIPAGFYADKGKAYPATGQTRTNGMVYGWTTDATANAVERHGSVPLTEFDTFIQAQTTTNNSWSIALPNGSYPVVVVAGDALSTDQTNNLVIAGQTMTDATPATTSPGYDQGNFDGYAIQATVTNGIMTITPGAGALRAKLCFVEIGAVGTTISQTSRDRLAALVARANAWTGASVPPQTAIREYAYQSYVDDVAAFTSSVNGGAATRYYVASNHLFTPAALTNAAGQVVERMEYTAYGKQTIKNDAGATLAKSVTGFDRGFTGYIADSETGLYYARQRMYSPTQGRFISRWFDALKDPHFYQYQWNNPANMLDPWGDPDGFWGAVAGALDCAGFLPVVGTAADLANAAISAAHGEWGDAGMNLVGAIPVLGDAAKGTKMAAKAAGAAADAAKGADKAADAAKGANKVGDASKTSKPQQRTPEENQKARNKFKNNKDEARSRWEEKTGQKWPTDENGNPWPAEHTPPLKEGGDPMDVYPRDPGAPDPHNIPGPDGLTDYQRWGGLGTPAREANKLSNPHNVPGPNGLTDYQRLGNTDVPCP